MIGAPGRRTGRSRPPGFVDGEVERAIARHPSEASALRRHADAVLTELGDDRETIAERGTRGVVA